MKRCVVALFCLNTKNLPGLVRKAGGYYKILCECILAYLSKPFKYLFKHQYLIAILCLKWNSDFLRNGRNIPFYFYGLQKTHKPRLYGNQEAQFE